MKLDPNTNVIACVPVDPGKRGGVPYNVGDGYIEGHCDGCGERIWVGPRSQKKANEGVYLMCIFCLFRLNVLTRDTQFRTLQELDSK